MTKDYSVNLLFLFFVLLSFLIDVDKSAFCVTPEFLKI